MYGSVRTVVWQGSVGDRRPYADLAGLTGSSFRIAKNNRSKSVCTLFQRKRLDNQTVWPVIFGLTGPICARALKSQHSFNLDSRGHQDWPVKLVIREKSAAIVKRASNFQQLEL